MIIITGATGGIGSYIFNYYYQKGYDVVGIYNSTPPKNNSDLFFQVDLTSEKCVKDFIAKTNPTNVILINAAGISLSGMAHKLDFASFKTSLDINTSASFLLIGQLLPYMRAENYGRIINISSVVPQIGAAGNVAYSASKAALWGMSKVIARENAEKGITSNCINLGYCNTGMIDSIPKNVLDKIIETIPLKKLCDLSNITNAIDFLINSDYITGSQIDINGGLY